MNIFRYINAKTTCIHVVLAFVLARTDNTGNNFIINFADLINEAGEERGRAEPSLKHGK